jgi:syntaxin-binding protein 5
VVSPLHGGTFVFDAYTGVPCKADKAHLTVALEFKPSPDAIEEKIRSLLLVAGAKGARCLADLGEERVAKVDWGHKAGTILRAQIVERNGNDHMIFRPGRF